jgi:hypothetical protein
MNELLEQQEMDKFREEEIGREYDEYKIKEEELKRKDEIQTYDDLTDEELSELEEIMGPRQKEMTLNSEEIEDLYKQNKNN